MITQPEEYKQRLLDIQNSTEVSYTTIPSEEPKFKIDLKNRSITVPKEFEFLGTKNEHNAETVYFEIDRYFDKTDLSEHTCIIQFENNQKNGGLYPVTVIDKESEEGKLIFGWEIKDDVTALAGDVLFAVRFYSIDENNKFTYNLNTLIGKSVILDTLDVDNPSIIENYPSELAVWLERMNELSTANQDYGRQIEEIRNEIGDINTLLDIINGEVI